MWRMQEFFGRCDGGDNLKIFVLGAEGKIAVDGVTVFEIGYGGYTLFHMRS